MKYGHVTGGGLDYRGSLPTNWKNISGIRKLDGNTAVLQPLGWLPLTEVIATLGVDEIVDGETIAITATAVTVTQTKRTMTTAELSARLLKLKDVRRPSFVK